MKYLDYREKEPHGTFDFPMEYYYLDTQHPQYEMMYHWHTDYEIIRVQRGELRMRLDGKYFTVRQGEVILISDGVMHGGTPVDCVYECLVFDFAGLAARGRVCPPQLRKILEHKRTIQMVLSSENEEVRQVVCQLLDAMHFRQPGYEFLAQGLLFQMIGLILQHHLYSHTEEPGRKTTEQLLSLKNAMAFIQENYSQKITLAQLAKAAGMSPKYFCSFFYDMTQKTPVEYLNFYRIECACEQLLSTEDTVTEIAFSCGFNDVSYFTKTFRKYTDTTPLLYRRKMTEEKAKEDRPGA